MKMIELITLLLRWRVGSHIHNPDRPFILRPNDSPAPALLERQLRLAFGARRLYNSYDLNWRWPVTLDPALDHRERLIKPPHIHANREEES
jgi:hypothetical protein